jgi:4-hydroxybenzoyl-CoA reductase subunit beta
MNSSSAFTVERPDSVAAAARLLACAPGSRLLAGGTGLLPNLRRGVERPAVLVDLGSVREFARIAATNDGLSIGAGATLSRLAEHPAIVRDYRAIAEAARVVAGPAHRSVATIGGNLCLDTRCVFYNQSEWWRAANHYCLKRGGETCHVAPQGKHCHAAFSGDMAPALLALGGEVELVASRGTRRLALAQLYRDDGAAHLTIAPDELIARVLVRSPPSGSVSGYRKATVRGAIDFPLAGVACALRVRGAELTELTVALTGTNSQPITLAGTQAFVGKRVDSEMLSALGKLVQKQVSPMRTTVTQSNYRRLVAAALAQRLVRELAQRETAGAAAN